MPINTASSKDFRINFIMQTNHLVTAARRSLLFLMVALLLGGGLSSAPANTADQVASSAKEAKPTRLVQRPPTPACVVWMAMT